MSTKSISFRARFLELAKQVGPLCVGCDPSPDLLRQWGLPVNVDGLADFCDVVVTAARHRAAVFKPQIAFFEPFGPEGMSVLRETVKRARAQDQLVIIDCKRGDIGHSVEAYARAYFGKTAPYEVDAITANAYLGFNTLQPMFSAAASADGMVFVVVRSSNPEGAQLQSAIMQDGLSVASSMARSIADSNRQDSDACPVGAVVGATLTPGEAEVLQHLNGALMLVPGVGAQGATFSDIAKVFGPSARFAIPSVSRGFLQSGPSPTELQSRLEQLSKDARHHLQSI